jgi:hypothetical protein
LGRTTSIEKIEIKWPSGTLQILDGIELNRLHEILEPNPGEAE